MRGLRTAPAVLAMLVLGAHFFRAGSYVATAACLLAPILFVLRLPWTAAASRIVLLAGCVVWMVTASRLTAARRALGEPWLRMALILAGVAAFTAASALLLPGASRGGGAGASGGDS